MKAAPEEGEPTHRAPALTIADGIAVRQIGAMFFSLVKDLGDDSVTVNGRAITNAVLVLLEIEKTVA